MARTHMGWGVLAILSLAGCSGGEGLSDRLAGSHVEGGPDHVVIHGMSSAADALPFAIGHCSHYGKSAQYERREGADFIYRCAPRG